MGLDTSAEYLVIQNTETVTYYVKPPHGPLPASGVTITYAYREPRDITYQDAATLLTVAATQWHMWKTPAGSIVPAQNDQFKDAGGVFYVIKEVHVESFGNRFRLVCQKRTP